MMCARYVAALAAKDTEELLEVFAADIVFRGMTPGRFWEACSPDEVVQQATAPSARTATS